MSKINFQKFKTLDELPSLALLSICYAGYAIITIHAVDLDVWISIALLVSILVLHSSLQHEFIHGHPFSNKMLNDLLVFPSIGLFVPYLRFKDLHLKHHYDPNLTDPYVDPESNFMDPEKWYQLSKWRQALGNFNNTLIGRMLIGPFSDILWYYGKDVLEGLKGDQRIAFSYIHHLFGLMPVFAWHMSVSSMPLWIYLIAAYLAMSVLKVRTFLEHTAHERIGFRTVVIEDRGLLALLFLNNNYHAVHHSNPRLTWHRLPEEFNKRRAEFLHRNDGYWFKSYWTVFRLYFFNTKDPVPHPLMEKSKGGTVTLPSNFSDDKKLQSTNLPE